MLVINKYNKKVAEFVSFTPPFIKDGKIVNSVFVDIEHFITHKELKAYYDNNNSYNLYNSIEKC